MVTNNIPKHWQVKKLGEVCQFTQGIQIDVNKQKDYQFENSVRFLRIIDFTQTGEPPRYIENPGDRYLLKKGEIAMVRYGTVGFVCIGKEGAIANNLFKINHNQEINSKYLINFLQSLFFLSKLETKGATMQALSFGLIKPIPIPIPPLPEQLAIVSKIEELLSDLENGKQQLLTAQQQLKVYRQSLLKAAFEGRLTNKEVKDGELPKGWKWVKIGDVCSNVEYGSATKSIEIGNVPVLRMGNIQKGRFDWGDLVYTDDEVEIKKYLLKKNDVLFNRTNSAELVGKTAIYKGERPAIFAGYLIRINRIEELIDADYLTYYLNTHAARQYGNSVRSFGVNQSNINGTKLKTYPIPLPSLSEQRQIVEILESKLTICDKIEETISQSLQQAETLKQSILKKAFEGKLV